MGIDASESSNSVVGSTTHKSITRPQYIVAILAFVVELLYLWVAAEALLFWPVHGAFFAAVAIGQGVLAVNLLFDPSRWTFRLGIIFNAGILVLWTIVRAVETVFPVWILAVRTPVDGVEYLVMSLVLSLLISLVWVGRDTNYRNDL